MACETAHTAQQLAVEDIGNDAPITDDALKRCKHVRKYVKPGRANPSLVYKHLRFASATTVLVAAALGVLSATTGFFSVSSFFIVVIAIDSSSSLLPLSFLVICSDFSLLAVVATLFCVGDVFCVSS